MQGGWGMGKAEWGMEEHGEWGNRNALVLIPNFVSGCLKEGNHFPHFLDLVNVTFVRLVLGCVHVSPPSWLIHFLRCISPSKPLHPLNSRRHCKRFDLFWYHDNGQPQFR